MFLKKNSCDKNQIKNYFHDNLDIILNLDDTLSLLLHVKIISVNEFNKYVCNIEEINDLNIFKSILVYLNKNKNIVVNKYEDGYSMFIIYHYYAIRNFLLDSNVITALGRNNFRIEKEFEMIVKNVLLKRKSINQLKKDLERKEELGNMAEEFVLEYEGKKYLTKTIEHVSPFDVSAGYDIKSYLNNDSNSYDKFIEVKCISNRDIFYWTKNEIETAKQLGDNYFLYLVNPSFINNPIEIKNPYKKIYLNNDINFLTEVISYKFSDIPKNTLEN